MLCVFILSDSILLLCSYVVLVVSEVQGFCLLRTSPLLSGSGDLKRVTVIDYVVYVKGRFKLVS